MKFIEILENPEGRRLIEAIEDTASSLRGKEGDKVLESCLAAMVKELEEKFGYHYDLD